MVKPFQRSLRALPGVLLPLPLFGFGPGTPVIGSWGPPRPNRVITYPVANSLEFTQLLSMRGLLLKFACFIGKSATRSEIRTASVLPIIETLVRSLPSAFNRVVLPSSLSQRPG